jgi:hypothetical protein
MLTLQQVARALGGEVRGNEVAAPGPGHSAKDRTLHVKLDANAPDGFIVNTFAPADDPIACKDYVRQRLALLWQIYSRRRLLQIHFRQCGHRCGGSRAKSSRTTSRDDPGKAFTDMRL